MSRRRSAFTPWEEYQFIQNGLSFQTNGTTGQQRIDRLVNDNINKIIRKINNLTMEIVNEYLDDIRVGTNKSAISDMELQSLYNILQRRTMELSRANYELQSISVGFKYRPIIVNTDALIEECMYLLSRVEPRLNRIRSRHHHY